MIKEARDIMDKAIRDKKAMYGGYMKEGDFRDMCLRQGYTYYGINVVAGVALYTPIDSSNKPSGLTVIYDLDK
jgi:Tfp pilus assembly protein PilZ